MLRRHARWIIAFVLIALVVVACLVQTQPACSLHGDSIGKHRKHKFKHRKHF